MADRKRASKSQLEKLKRAVADAEERASVAEHAAEVAEARREAEAALLILDVEFIEPYHWGERPYSSRVLPAEDGIRTSLLGPPAVAREVLSANADEIQGWLEDVRPEKGDLLRITLEITRIMRGTSFKFRVIDVEVLEERS